MKLDKPIKHSEVDQIKLNSFKELFFTYHGRLVLFANKFTYDKQAAQDLVQDTFLKLWEKTEDMSSIESPKAYLFQSVRNSCINYQRHLNIKKSAREELVSKLDSMEKSMYFDLDDPLHSLFEKEIEEKVDELVRSLPEKCRQVFTMSRQDYLKNKQIAEKLGISVKMVEKHISKALSILRAGLSEHTKIILFAIINKF